VRKEPPEPARLRKDVPDVSDRGSARQTIQHIVLVRWKPGTTDAQVLEACRKAAHLPNEIDGVQRITVGRDRANSAHGFTHALIVHVADDEALARYLDHPLRSRYVAEHLDPIVDERFVLDVRADLTLDRDSEVSWWWGAGIGMRALALDD
jgi:hypothetical protein